MHATAKTLGGLRDALLVLLSATYLLGYLTWAWHASRKDLGLLPALDAQYFAAGVLPLVVLLVAITIVSLLVRFSRWSKAIPTPRRLRWGRWLTGGGIALALASGLAGLVVESASAGVAVAAYLVMAGSQLEGARANSLFRWYGLGTLWLAVILVIPFTFLAYAEEIFPRIAQSFGGPRPRCVAIDVQRSGVSPRTLALITPPGATDTAAVVRSRPLALLFEGGGYLVFEARSQVERATDPVVTRIASSAVQALAVHEGCEER